MRMKYKTPEMNVAWLEKQDVISCSGDDWDGDGEEYDGVIPIPPTGSNGNESSNTTGDVGNDENGEDVLIKKVSEQDNTQYTDGISLTSLDDGDIDNTSATLSGSYPVAVDDTASNTDLSLDTIYYDDNDTISASGYFTDNVSASDSVYDETWFAQ